MSERPHGFTVKNDRINTIRKQYDAFLEEDKKRRERNEYILGKLDKMRSSTALVPISSTPHQHLELNPYEINLRPINKRMKSDIRDNYVPHLERHNITSGVIHKDVEELNMLKEISKNYILIPKRTTAIRNDCINYNTDIIDEDWKSKYNILDDLKRLEKEGLPETTFSQNNDNIRNIRFDLREDSNISDKNPSNLDNNTNNFNSPTSDKNSELSTSNNFMVEQEKTRNIDAAEIKNQHYEETVTPVQVEPMSSNEFINVDQTQPVHAAQQLPVNTVQENMTDKEIYNSTSNEKDLNLSQTFNNNLQISGANINNEPMHLQESINQPEYNVPTAESNIYIPSNHIEANASNGNNVEQIISNANSLINQPEYHVPTAESNIYIPSNHIEANASNDNNAEQIISDEKSQEPSSITYEESVNTSHRKQASEIQDLTTPERVTVYDDVDNNPERQIGSNETNDDIHNDSVKYSISGVENIQQLDHEEHESEINAFEAEQKEMFYSEQSGETYAENQAEYNTGDYIDGYEQNEQYAYYEGVQQEQAYATNINEHEESTERYDPHYNEQYEGSYEHQQPGDPVNYENNNAYDQQQYQVENPQFENVVNYENQQENLNVYQQENMSSEHEVQENILTSQDNQMYDQHQYTVQPESQEHIEQQLMVEEGYTENNPVITNDYNEYQNENEEDVNVITPTEEVMPNPKMS